MVQLLRTIAILFLWFSLMWGFGVILHVGFKNNPRQRKISVGGQITKLLTWGTVDGEVAIVPTLVQLNALVFLIYGIAEYIISGFARPTDAFKIWLIGFVACALLTPLMNRRGL